MRRPCQPRALPHGKHLRASTDTSPAAARAGGPVVGHLEPRASRLDPRFAARAELALALAKRYREAVNVSGYVIRSRYLYLRSLGDDAVAQVAERLSPRVREIVEKGVLETQWYPFDDLIELMVTTDETIGEGDLQMCYEMGRFGCETNLTGIYRIFFRFGSINFILKRAAKAFRAQYDAGEMELVKAESGFCQLRLSDFPRPHRAHCLAIKGWMTRAGELTGAEMLDNHETCRASGDDNCEWTFRYR